MLIGIQPRIRKPESEISTFFNGKQNGGCKKVIDPTLGDEFMTGPNLPAFPVLSEKIN